MSNPSLLVVGLVCGATCLIFAYLLFIWWLDRYEREPFWVVVAVFLWGALGSTMFSCLINSVVGAGLALGFGHKSMAQTATSVVVAPLVEEFMKGLVFLPLLLLGKQVDNRTDGLIYGAAAGLGFACVENLYYYIKVFDPNHIDLLIQTVFLRTLFTTLVHCVSSALLGMAIGHASHKSGLARWLVLPALGYLLAVLNHASWNGMIAVTSVFSDNPNLAVAIRVMGLGFVLLAGFVMFVLTQIALHEEHEMIQDYLHKEAKLGTLPDAHADIVPFWLKRRRRGWLAEHVDRDAYLRASTMLAFRLHQSEQSKGARKEKYDKEIASYRREVRTLLGRR